MCWIKAVRRLANRLNSARLFSHVRLHPSPREPCCWPFFRGEWETIDRSLGINLARKNGFWINTGGEKNNQCSPAPVKWRKSAIQLVSRVIELRRKRHPSNTCISNLRLNRDPCWLQLCCRVNRSMTSRVMFGFTLVKYVARHYRSSMGSEVIITALSRTQQHHWVCYALLRDIIDAQLFRITECKHSMRSGTL